MERIVLRHLSGSKANQVEEFPLSHFKELTLGRDPAASVRYDAERDDLVGRNHARVEPDPSDPNQFVIIDLGSRNGTYLNKNRISERAKIAPGDIVQLGPGGPEFQFDLEPRPENYVRPTRVVESSAASSGLSGAASVPHTRETTAPADGGGSRAASDTAPATGAHRPVGKQTVERMLSETKSESRRQSYAVGGVILAVVLLAGGYLAWHFNSKISAVGTPTNSNAAPADPNAPKEMTTTQIAEKFAPSVVWLEVSWKLIHTDTGGQIYHQYVVQNGQRVPAYISSADGKSVEPFLTLASNGNKPIGSSHGGSGFVITQDGFILTNAHVAASWNAPYNLPPGVLVEPMRGGLFKVVSQVEQGPTNWIPAEAIKSRRSLTDRPLEGRNDYLYVTFPENKLRIPGTLARISDEQDVAMVKINLPEPLPVVQLYNNYDQIKQGDPITVIGYPLASQVAQVAVRVQSKSGQLGPGDRVAFVPEPSVTTGVIGRVIKSGSDQMNYYSFAGDTYQHTATTNPGNSGGPVFDHYGRVVAIHNAGVSLAQGTNFAVPIKYGMDLMGTKSVTR